MLTSLPEYKNKHYGHALDVAFKKVDEAIISEEGKKILREKLFETRGDNVLDDRLVYDSGSGANVVLITPEKYFIANIGDSRSVLCRNGNTIRLSQDHKP